MDVAIVIETIRHEFQVLAPLMSERMRRLWAASEVSDQELAAVKTERAEFHGD